MKAKLVLLALAGVFGGTLQASTVISCSWSTSALNSCFNGGLTNFVTKLDWAAFGTPDGSVQTGLWTASTGGYNITVSTTGTDSGEGARTAYDFASVKAIIGGQPMWTSPGFVGDTTYNFAGHFNSITDNQPASPQAPDSPYGDHLIGLRGDGSTTGNVLTKDLVVDFGTTVSNVGFRIAANSDFSFNTTVQFFGGANGTGASLGTFTLNSLTAGGTCAGLTSVGGSAPVPCNDAQFIAALGLANARSMTLATTDVDGFWIGDLNLTSVPEPTPLIFAGSGLFLLFIGRKRWRRS